MAFSREKTNVRFLFNHWWSENEISFLLSFELNTAIEYPHEQSINSILFQPLVKEDNLKCVSVGNDKKFKVWKLVDFENIYSK